ncbi:uncharacterized protein M421DRAFT_162869 [Didymella exigua CBS 183.55]|uniref:Uncharacterized protein n=1 Tax=Didymella exigua CBS 183.55 TaxID=1150837 RepID=A0A6A5RNI5_9PLEO|nr:uncharacterized protein M421DRAFT_162869 [Didymella exigua CBS 183.55]KAF1927896.1 hypothetical protein M421DRAFT_162869 [Didymella exigua CBS 183.55]
MNRPPQLLPHCCNRQTPRTFRVHCRRLTNTHLCSLLPATACLWIPALLVLDCLRFLTTVRLVVLSHFSKVSKGY